MISMLVTDHCCALGPQRGISFPSFAIKGLWMGKGETCCPKDIRATPPGTGVAFYRKPLSKCL